MGGVGMLSAGFLGGPGIGFKQDYYASEQLKEKDPEVHRKFAAAEDNSFYGLVHVRGLNGKKVGEVVEQRENLEKAVSDAKETKDAKSIAAAEAALTAWKASEAGHADKVIEEASLHGGRMALTLTAAVPAAMAVIYLLLIIYFKLQGGYKRIDLAPDTPTTEPHPYGITERPAQPSTGIKH
jgi:hypothetical protein